MNLWQSGRRTLTWPVAVVLLGLGAGVNTTRAADEPALPAPEKGKNCFRVALPKLADPSLARVELIAGKTVETDGVNHVSLGGSIKAEAREGQRIYMIRTGGLMSTLIGVPPGHPRGSQFVSVNSGLLPYDSSQTLAIYAADDLTVSYRVWRAKETREFDQGPAEAEAIKWAGSNMKAYKPAPEGYVRHVMRLPVLPDENAVRVELVAGKLLAVANPENCSFSGAIKETMIEGWQFPRYDVTLGELAGAKEDPSAAGAKKFVRLGGEPKLFRYNSRLPLVVYVPEGAELCFRIWSPDAKPSELKPAPPSP
jgi:ecotin